jgi:LacI family transcriptional regulator, sucrose operon repressor
MATIHDVAEMAGVSVTTVSRVMNNRGYISEETRRRVYACMEELNYQPNEIARSLLRKQSNLIGLIVPTVAHPFFSELASHIEAYAYEIGSKVLLCNSQLDPVKERDYIDMMKRNRVDGIIMGSHTLEVDAFKHLNGVVTLDRQIDDRIPYVSSDNYEGGRLATRLLIDKGCRNIAHICGNQQLQLLANRRTDAFRDEVQKQGIEHVIIETDMNVFNQQQYEAYVNRLFEEHKDVDGVFATSDIIAAYVIKMCHKLGRRIPEDVRIVGYDDVNHANWFTPALTTVRQPLREMARQAVEMIRRQSEGDILEPAIILPVELIERETT